MNKIPRTVTITLILIALNAIFWFGYAVNAVRGVLDPDDSVSLMVWIMAGLAFASAVALVVVAVLLRRRVRLAYYVGMGLLALIAVLSVTDQVGLLDVASLAISLTPVVLMIKDRKWYLGKQTSG
ncbi:hypothetical protein KQH50_02510 [bacterium]|nr:hypothetical protein [bacterium]